MRAPGFWFEPPGLIARLLWPAGSAYGAIAGWRMAQTGHDPGLPVICIGNFVAGGAGKTPTAIAIARQLKAAGRRPVFLSRGYGRRSTGALVADLAHHGPQDLGDEPLLLARHAPIVVAADRIAGARLAAPLGDIIVMDDGLHNPALAKTLALAVVDGASGIGNGFCLPAGPLRAPLMRQLPCVDAVVLVGTGAPGELVARAAQAHGIQILRARLEPDEDMAQIEAGERVYAFAGIGRPQKFFDSLAALGAEIAVSRSFPDHHPYTRREIEAILLACEADALVPVTTEKDMVRLSHLLDAGMLASIRVLPVHLVFDDPGACMALLAGVLKA